MTANEPGSGWQSKSEGERKRILGVVEAAGRMGFSWKRTAGLLGVAEKTLIRWRKDDPKGVIDLARETGKAKGGEEVVDLMFDFVRNPEAKGAASVLIHLSKHLADMGDKSTHTVVTPKDLAGGDDGTEDARRSYALKALGLEALDATKAKDDDES